MGQGVVVTRIGGMSYGRSVIDSCSFGSKKKEKKLSTIASDKKEKKKKKWWTDPRMKKQILVVLMDWAWVLIGIWRKVENLHVNDKRNNKVCPIHRQILNPFIPSFGLFWLGYWLLVVLLVVVVVVLMLLQGGHWREMATPIEGHCDQHGLRQQKEGGAN